MILVAEKQQIGRFCAPKHGSSCLAMRALAESQQLPVNREVKAGVRGTSDLTLFSPDLIFQGEKIHE
jgi:hypothetical protein